MDLEARREYYAHGSQCTEKNFTDLNENGMKTCLDCAGIFDKDNKGLCVTDKRFDSWREKET